MTAKKKPTVKKTKPTKRTKSPEKAKTATVEAQPTGLKEPNALIVPTELPQSIANEQRSALTITGKALILDVRDATSSEEAASILVSLKDIEKQLKQRQDYMLAPLKAATERIKGLFAPAMAQLKQADDALRIKLSSYQAEQHRVREAERKRLLKEAVEASEEGDTEVAADLATSAAAIVPEAKSKPVDGGGKVQTSMVWKFKVTNEAKVPREYLKLDDTKVRAAIKNGIREVEGLEIFQEAQLSVYSRPTSGGEGFEEVPF